VFTDREQALIFCATHGCELEEYEAGSVKMETDKPVQDVWLATFNYLGELVSADTDGFCLGMPTHAYFNAFSQHFFLRTSIPVDTDVEKARKIICDEFAKWKYQMIEEGKLGWLRK
jgi:hypothetical protein